NAARHDIVDQVVHRVMAETTNPLFALNDAAYHEIKRLEPNPGTEREILATYRDLARSLGKMADAERRARLELLVRSYAWNVAGNFDPRVYKFTSRIVPTLISGLISPLRSLMGGDSAAALRE